MLLSKPTRFLDHISPAMLEQLALVEEGHQVDWGRYRDRDY
jgi:DNA helicase-2/ATP-dependent DNA helicase PcrA